MNSESDTTAAIRETAYRLLSRREHSEVEMSRKLCSRRFDPAQVEQVIQELVYQRHLSDERFTESFVRDRYTRGQGPAKISRDLLTRGIDDSLASRYLSVAGHDWSNLAIRCRTKKFGDKSPGDFREWARQARFLQGRGFTTDQVREAMAIDALNE